MKRLIRRYLRKKLYRPSFVSVKIDPLQKANDDVGWILDAPLWQWRARYWCVVNESRGYPKEKLFSWLTDRTNA
ncbi:MAG: hypothetical protein HFJ94_10140 [Muribaculaceae bacterium]|nr:hypothetical protein [Muribaculaceae bacterium]